MPARLIDARRWCFAIFALSVLALVVAACGSSGSGSGSGESTTEGAGAASSAVEKTVEKFSQEITSWPGPNEPVKPPGGKSITVITCGSQGITCVRVANGVTAAGKALGYNVKVVDGQSQPTVWNQALQAAVTSKADGIVLAAVPPSLVGAGIEKAEAAQIPVAAVLSVLGAPTAVKVDYPRTEVVEANSAFIAAESGGGAKVLELVAPEFPETAAYPKEYAKDLAADCSGCEVVESIKFTLALASQRLAGDVAQALQQNPEINYITMPFDTINPFVIQGVRQAAKTGKVKLVGIGADPPSIQAIESGEQVMSLGTPAEWMGWDAVDGLVRTFAGDPVPPLQKKTGTETNYSVPMRYVTKEDLSGPEGWQGDLDYQQKFEELWGVG
jgi:ribose transport system substrate-binding protein